LKRRWPRRNRLGKRPMPKPSVLALPEAVSEPSQRGVAGFSGGGRSRQLQTSSRAVTFGVVGSGKHLSLLAPLENWHVVEHGADSTRLSRQGKKPLGSFLQRLASQPLYPDDGDGEVPLPVCMQLGTRIVFPALAVVMFRKMKSTTRQVSALVAAVAAAVQHHRRVVHLRNLQMAGDADVDDVHNASAVFRRLFRGQGTSVTGHLSRSAREKRDSELNRVATDRVSGWAPEKSSLGSNGKLALSNMLISSSVLWSANGSVKNGRPTAKELDR
jgi:hypothetical protein